MKLRWVFAASAVVLGAFIWASDNVTLQGERTVYTVECTHGAWNGQRCGGQLVAGPRFRYRALKLRGEVLFWALGTPEPSSKLTGCTIKDGRNWTCPVTAEAPRSVTLALVRGEPVRNPAWPTRPFHAVSKLNWALLNLGLNVTQTAE